MKRLALSFCLTVAFVVAGTFAFSTPAHLRDHQQETAQQRCKRGCNEKRDACLRDVESKDDEHTRARRNACYDAWAECERACEN